MNPLARLDQRHLWHPFTQMKDWLRTEPTVIVSGRGSVLRDAQGKKYLDANSSIWTNLHGHAHPKINRAIEGQLKKISHSSALGLANEPASLLGAQLVRRARGKGDPALSRVFFSDDGSTAMEVALKLAYEFARRSGRAKAPKFLSVGGAYHGDTIGAVSLGHIDLFHRSYKGLLFKSDSIASPYCYRCPHNRAQPERRDAREYRKCGLECLDHAARKFSAQRRKGADYAALVVEPLMQGAAGMIAQPEGWLKGLAEIARAHGTQLIADEVMTGFGRSGISAKGEAPLFACQRAGVRPDYLALAKGLTGGYLPMAATLTTDAVFSAFLGDYAEFKTFFHGHSYTGNQLGAAASLASLDLLDGEESKASRRALQASMGAELERLWRLPQVGDIRRVGLMAGVELVRDWRTRAPFDLRERVGIRVCEGMARRGVLTRPIGNVIVIMPPYCTTPGQMRKIARALEESVKEIY